LFCRGASPPNPRRDAQRASPRKRERDPQRVAGLIRVASPKTKPLLAAVGAGQITQTIGMLGRELSGLQAPGPIPLRPSREIHSRLASQAQDVLDRRDRGISHRSEREPNQSPGDRLALTPEVLPGVVALGLVGAAEP